MWIELHDTAYDDARIMRVAKALNLRRVEIIGHLSMLWLFAAKQALLSGNLEPWGPEGIEEAAKWDGNPGQFVAAIRQAGLLVKDWLILDWDKFTTHHVLSEKRVSRIKSKSRQRAQRYRNRQRDARMRDESMTPTENVTQTITPVVTAKNGDNLTQPNPTITKLTTSGQARQPTSLQLAMGAYKKAKGLEANDKEWDAANWSRFARAAKKVLGAFGDDAPAAVVYILGKGREWSEKDISWTLDTIAVHAWDDRGKLGREDGDVCEPVGDSERKSQVGANRLVGPGGFGCPTPAGELATSAIEHLRRNSGLNDTGKDGD